MKSDYKSPAFSTDTYVRPNLDWECGKLCQGCPCRIGPSPKGKCRVSFECSPKLVTKEGESKGHWTCTRPKSGGGKCENGPRPDGSCCNAIPKCQPRRTLRNIRKRVVAFTIIATILVLFIGLSRENRDDFTNPGPLSTVHASEAFKDMYAKIHASQGSPGNTSTCAACHESARQGADTWFSKTFDSLKHGLAPADLIKKGPLESTAMDASCLACHSGKDFHQPNMPQDFACYECHKEHEGSGFMADVSSSYCTSCHGSAELMASARELAGDTDPHAFPSFLANSDLKIQSRERPEEGYTDVITAFHLDHPEFRLLRDKVKDVNTLKFNHAVHLKTGDIPRQLSCTECHEQDGEGEYQKPITYQKHCVECHSLQFDPDTLAQGDKPGISLPHGDPYYVRSFLRSLNIQYEEYARSYEGITRPEDLSAYVQEKRKGIESLYETGENLEHGVFFADMQGKTPQGLQVPFAGCATCHDVSEPMEDNGTPVIAKVAIPDRWMTIGKFNHALHKNGLSCLDCHDVMNSELTSDVNLPSIKSCTDCHSPQGGIDNRCTSCHSYHNTLPTPIFPPATTEE